MKLLNNLALLLLCLSVNAYAKQSDKDQPTVIEADRVEMHDKQSTSIYSGNVVITRGSIKITGDKITIKNKDGSLQSATAIGQPATFYQLNDLGETITAQSNKIIYRARSGLLELQEDAELVKNKNRFSSAHIIYDTNKDIVKAGHKNKPETSTPPRVQVTLQPENKNNNQK